MKKVIYKIISIIIITTIFGAMFGKSFAPKVYAAVTQTTSTNIDGIDDTKYPGVKAKIKALQQAHPNWKFKVFYTNLNWNDVIAHEYVGHSTNVEENDSRNFVPNTYSEEWICSICGKTVLEDKWYCASEGAIKYMMDPRNILTEENIFQFQDLLYNDGYTDTMIKAMISGSFLDKTSYINTITKSCKGNNMSPYYIIARILQEQGKDGTSPLISGKYSGYEGYYNIFNIEAAGTNRVVKGLEKAKKEGWNSMEKAIEGGIKWIKEGYIDAGQTTLYLQKFDVESAHSGMYWHQYMTNLIAPKSEASRLKQTYKEANAINNNFTFLVPLYENMPTNPCLDPANTTNSTDLVKLNVNGTLALRSGPSSDNSKLADVKKETIVTRLEKAETRSSDGYYWDKVLLSNGLTGYMARETKLGATTYKLYLVPVDNNGNEIDYSKEIEINESTKLITVTPKITVENVQTQFKNTITVKNANGEAISEEKLITTNSKVTVDGKTYIVIKLADVTCDGKITALDYAKIKNHKMELALITDANAQKAADITRDSKITALDYAGIKNYFMNDTKIEL